MEEEKDGSQVEHHRKILITKIVNKLFVWNADDVYELRTKHRICGCLVGSLPRKPWQTNINALPLLLLPEEAYLCCKLGITEIQSSGTMFSMRTEDPVAVVQHEESRCQVETDQIKIFKSMKKEKEKLYYGNNRKEARKERKKLEKSGESLGSKDLTDSKLNSATSSSDVHPGTYDVETDQNWSSISLNSNDLKYYSHSVRVHIPTSVSTSTGFTTGTESFHSNDDEGMRYTVFEDLWKKGYYITSAEKFGGDYLVYPGDPLRYHSFFIVLIMGKEKKLSTKEMICYGRLAASVKKTVVMATISHDGVSYLSLGWTHMKT